MRRNLLKLMRRNLLQLMRRNLLQLIRKNLLQLIRRNRLEDSGLRNWIGLRDLSIKILRQRRREIGLRALVGTWKNLLLGKWLILLLLVLLSVWVRLEIVLERVLGRLNGTLISKQRILLLILISEGLILIGLS